MCGICDSADGEIILSEAADFIDELAQAFLLRQKIERTEAS